MSCQIKRKNKPYRSLVLIPPSDRPKRNNVLNEKVQDSFMPFLEYYQNNVPARPLDIFNDK